MGVDYTAYAVVGLPLDDVVDTEIGKKLIELKEEDDWEYLFEDRYGPMVLRDSAYTNRPRYFVGFDIERNSLESIKEKMDKFRALFGMDAEVNSWLSVW